MTADKGMEDTGTLTDLDLADDLLPMSDHVPLIYHGT